MTNDPSMKTVQVEMERAEDTSLPFTEEFKIWMLLGQVADGMLKARDNELRPFGLSSIQVGVMYAVKVAGGSLTGIEISRRLLRRPSSVYRLLERMEKQGLVNCIRNEDGKREVRVVLTDKGEQLYSHQTREVIPRILGGLSTEEGEQFKGTLRKLRTKVFEELAEYPSFP